jgi:hypothetical protein
MTQILSKEFIARTEIAAHLRALLGRFRTCARPPANSNGARR